jgi:hypothetical protein
MLTCRKYTHLERSPHSTMKGALVDVLLAPTVVPGTCSSHPTTHIHHAGVHGPKDATKLHVDEATVASAIPIDVLPLSGPHWPDNLSTLKGSSWGDQERTSGPAKFELIRYFIQNLI